MSQQLGAVTVLLVVITRLRLHLLPGVTIPLPESLLAVTTLACAAVALLDIQLIRAFKSSPAPRIRSGAVPTVGAAWSQALAVHSRADGAPPPPTLLRGGDGGVPAFRPIGKAPRGASLAQQAPQGHLTEWWRQDPSCTTMAFLPGYIVLGSKRERVRQLGNAVTPPVAEILISALVEAITGQPLDEPSPASSSWKEPKQ